MIIIKYILLISIYLIVFTTTSLAQQRKVIVVQGGRKVERVKTDTLPIKDSTLIKSGILINDSTIVDTTFIKDPSKALYKDSLSTITNKELSLVTQAIDKRKRFNLIKDTISPTLSTLLSLVPGMGQIYNRQSWKAPIFYVGIGAFVAGGIITTNKYNRVYAKWQNAINMSLPNEILQPLQRQVNSYGSLRTVSYALAGAMYLYQIADATYNYKGYDNPVRKSTILAAIFPGAGLIYTKTYWRLPIYYSGFIALATVIDFNNRSFKRYKIAYAAMVDNDPTTHHEFEGSNVKPDQVKNARNSFRRNRDLGIIGLIGTYALSIIDTYVIATLKNWDVDEDLSINVEPTIFSEYDYYNASLIRPVGNGAGLKLTIDF